MSVRRRLNGGFTLFASVGRKCLLVGEAVGLDAAEHLEMGVTEPACKRRPGDGHRLPHASSSARQEEARVPFWRAVGARGRRIGRMDAPLSSGMPRRRCCAVEAAALRRCRRCCLRPRSETARRAPPLSRSLGSIRMRPAASLSHSWIPVIARLTFLAGVRVPLLVRGDIAEPHGCERERPDDDAPRDTGVLLGDQQRHADAEQRNRQSKAR